MHKIVKFINHQDKEMLEKYFVLLEEKDNCFVVEELVLSGLSFEPLEANKNDLIEVSSLAPHWKAAYLVWKNSKFKEEFDFSNENKYKNKILELLANKYSIDKNILFELIKELEEINYFS